MIFHTDLHAQSRILHLCTGQFWIDGCYDLGMIQLSMVEYLVKALEYSTRAVAIWAEEVVCGWGISRLCLRPQRGYVFGVSVDIDGHCESRTVCDSGPPGNKD